MAGKRAGLKHSANGDDETTRSGLFMEAVRIIKEMRRATNGKYPKYAIWENVMGAFSSNGGNDFRVVLEEFIKICEPEAPPIPSPGKGGWPHADCIVGNGFSLAYRVFDAQYWPGTPQRRKRIYLVLDLTGECAEKILFERPGLRGHSEEIGTPWKGAAEDPQGRSGTDDQESGCVVYDSHPQDSRIKECKGVAPTVAAKYAKGTADTPLVCVATQQGGAEISENGICPTITAAAGMSGNNQPWICKPPAYGVTCKGNGDSFVSEERHTALSAGGGQPGQGFPCAMVPVAFTQNQRDELRDLGDKAGALQAEPGMKQQTFIIDNIGGQAEYGKESHVNGTLRSGSQGAVAYCFDARGNGDGKIANTITGDHNGHISDYTALACYCMAHGQANAEICEDLSPTLSCNHEQPIVFDKEVYNSGANASGGHYISEGGPAPTLRGTGHAPGICDNYIVRRLTPTECARLQGFPDRWGDIPQKDTLTDEEYSFWLNVRNTHAAINGRTTKEYTKDQILKWYNKLHSDSSEYKMWGNGIALPNALYVMQGIAEVISHG